MSRPGPKGLRVLVCGGRNFNDYELMKAAMSHLKAQVGLIIHGDAQGADKMAGEWAEHQGIQQVKVPANWSGRGRAAGMERNQLMLDLFQPDVVVAMPGGVGTVGMVRIAEKAKIDTLIAGEWLYASRRNG